jgi:hypothetical protein
MFRRDRVPYPDRAKSPPIRRSFNARTVNMTAPQGSLHQVNLGEIALNGAFSLAWGRRA